MSRIALLFTREVRSFFGSAVFWIFVCLAWLITGLDLRYRVLEGTGGELSDMIFHMGIWSVRIQLVFVPLLTMRMLADEKRTGTYEMLVTTPVRDHEVVLGKFLAAVAMNAMTWLVIPLAFLVLSKSGGDPDFGVVWTSYFGVVSIGAVFVAGGILASATTQHQILAGFLGIVLLMLILFLPSLASGWTSDLGKTVGLALMVGNLDLHVREASVGIIDLVNLTYQLCMTALFLLFAVRILEVRKWR